MNMPHSEDHEIALASTCMWEPLTCGRDALEMFGDENPFFLPECRLVWSAIQRIDLAEISVLTVSDCLGDQLSYLRIKEFNERGRNVVNYNTHLKWVQKHYIQRKLIALMDKASAELHDDKGKPDEIVDSVRNGVSSIICTGSESFHDAVEMSKTTLEAALAGASAGLYTHHWRLDQIIAPIPEGSLITLAGYTGQGKTTLYNSIQRFLGEQGVASALFSMEMPIRQVAWRIVAGIIGRNSRPSYLAQNALTDPAIEKGFHAFGGMPIYCKDTPSMSARELRREIKALNSSKGVKVFAVDHIQLVRQENGKLSREQHIGEVTRVLKETAMDIGGWIFQISQLNRSSQSSTTGPAIHHLRDSGSIEQDSDIVVLVHDKTDDAEAIRKCRLEESVDVNLIVGKNRHGGCGRLIVPFHKWCSLFGNDALKDEEIQA